MRWGWVRLAALGGVAAVAFWVIGILIQESSSIPDDEGNATQVAQWYLDESNSILASGFIFMLGVLFFFLFLGALRVRLLEAEGQVGFLTAITYAAGIVTGLCLLLLPTADMAAALAEEDISGDAVLALHNLGDMFFIGAELGAALLVAVAGLLVFQTRVLPVWLGWASLVLALWLLIPPVGWAGLLLGFPLWTILVGVLLWLRPAGEPSPPAGVSQG
jgi:hypothetical protein